MYDAIKAAGIRHPEFVMAQCIQETGWLNCKKCCLRYNNLFGFYIKGNKCKKFTSEEECIEYYKSWQDKRYDKWRKKNPKADYYHFLKSAGWYVGYLETKDNVYYFSNCIQTNDFSKVKARIDIVYLILDELKLMRE